MLSFIIVIGVVFLWIRICAGFFFIFCLYMYCRWRSSYQQERVEIQLSRGEGWDPVIKRKGLRSSYQEERVGIPLTGLTPPHFYACPKPGPEFPTSYVVVFLCSVSSEVILRFVDIGEIDDHHCLNFLFIIVKFFF